MKLIEKLKNYWKSHNNFLENKNIHSTEESAFELHSCNNCKYSYISDMKFKCRLRENFIIWEGLSKNFLCSMWNDKGATINKENSND